MDTIKTAAVVALLLAVLYGVYTVLNKEHVPPPAEISALTEHEELLTPPDIDLGLEGLEEESLEDMEPVLVAEAPAAQPTGDDARIYVDVEPREQPGKPATRLPQVPSSLANGESGDSSIYVEMEPRPARSEQVTGPDTAQADTAQADAAHGDSTPGATAHGIAAQDGTDDVTAGSAAVVPRDPNAASPPDPASHDTDPVAVTGPPTTPPADSSAGQPAGDDPQVSIYSQPAPPSTTPQTDLASGDASESPSTRPAQGSGASLAPTRWTDVKRQAESQLADGKYRDALTTLSGIYGDPTLTGPQQQELLDMLDPLAGRVIYSTQHLLEPAYQVRGTESLQQIAKQYDVPWQLLQNINGVSNPNVLLPGTTLKVVRGPFRAEVDLDGAEMTLFLDQLYAGRFPIMVGSQPSPAPGDYAVQDKQEGRTYYSTDGTTLPANHPDNPYGSVWIDLGVNSVCIHGSPSRDSGLQNAGCIGLSPIDARDLFGILSQGSRVTVYR